MKIRLSKTLSGHVGVATTYHTNRGTKRTTVVQLTDDEASKLAHRLMSFASGQGHEAEDVIDTGDDW